MSRKEIILVVEDNSDLRKGLKEMLNFEGYMTFTAGNGREALEQMKAISPDLILSDITMPEMDGYEFFDAVRSRPEGVTTPFIFLTARGEREDVMRGKNLGAEDYLIKPLTRNELVSAIQSRLNRFRQLQLAQLEQAYQSSLIVLANAIEVRDHYTRGHVERVTEYSLLMGELMGLHGMRLDVLRYGAILHDIGKILVEKTIWNKSGPLSEEERRQINQHTVRGVEMIKDISYLASAIPAVRHHHERWDGHGYPDGLAGNAIPLEARIIAIADSFDAMTTDRPYHLAWSIRQAFEEIIRNSGTIYDPSVVEAFRKCWEAERIQVIAKKWLLTSEA